MEYLLSLSDLSSKVLHASECIINSTFNHLIGELALNVFLSCLPTK